MADVTVLGFWDGTQGYMSAHNLGGGLVVNVWDITHFNEVSSTISLPTTLSKVLFADGWVESTAPGDVSGSHRRVTAYDVCAGGPYVAFSCADVTVGTGTAADGSAEFHAIAFGY